MLASVSRNLRLSIRYASSIQTTVENDRDVFAFRKYLRQVCAHQGFPPSTRAGARTVLAA
jgi:hypothetical protein